MQKPVPGSDNDDLSKPLLYFIYCAHLIAVVDINIFVVGDVLLQVRCVIIIDQLR